MVSVHGSGVSVDRLDHGVALAEVRHRVGGPSPLAVLTGALAGMGTGVVLGLGAASLLSEAYQHQWWGRSALTATGLAAAVVVGLLSALATGWTTGRSSRYGGARGGVLAGVLLVLLTAGVAALLRSQRSFFRTAALPSWVRDATTSSRTLLIAFVLALLVPVVAALTARAAQRWHSRADDVLLGTRAGGVSPYPSVEVS